MDMIELRVEFVILQSARCWFDLKNFTSDSAVSKYCDLPFKFHFELKVTSPEGLVKVLYYKYNIYESNLCLLIFQR